MHFDWKKNGKSSYLNMHCCLIFLVIMRPLPLSKQQKTTSESAVSHQLCLIMGWTKIDFGSIGCVAGFLNRSAGGSPISIQPLSATILLQICISGSVRGLLSYPMLALTISSDDLNPNAYSRVIVLSLELYHYILHRSKLLRSAALYLPLMSIWNVFQLEFLSTEGEQEVNFFAPCHKPHKVDEFLKRNRILS
jgi:hypothetical protein